MIGRTNFSRRKRPDVRTASRFVPDRHAGASPPHHRIAQETERRGFAGIYVPSPSGNMSTVRGAGVEHRASITFGTAIAPIYQRTMVDFAQSAAMMHEVSGGRFRLGIGIAHGPSMCGWA